MKNVLFLCNTVYQVMVACWINHTYYKGDNTDIIVSDHMNDFEGVATRIREQGIFREVYSIRSRDYVYKPETFDNSVKAQIKRSLQPEKQMGHIIRFRRKYDVMIASNLDTITQLIFNVLKNDRRSKVGNKDLKLYIFEDGIITYSRLFLSYYNECKNKSVSMKHRLFDKICNNEYIYGNITGMYLFNPELMMYKPDWELIPIKKIDKNDDLFRRQLNYIFRYDQMNDSYDRKIIFMEESLYIGEKKRPDLELLNRIADEVGKENIMVKIHPRNPENIFENEGYKTNKNTAIPWELILINNDFSDKRLITIGSSSVLNPVTVFGISIKTYSLYNCLAEKPVILKGDFWDCIKYQYGVYSDCIKIYDSIEEIIDDIKH